MFVNRSFPNAHSPWISGLKLPLGVGFCVALAASVITLFMPNYYRSQAQILPVEGSGGGNLSNLAAAAAAFGVGVPGGDGNDANFVDILNSRWLLENLLKSEFTFKIRAGRFGGETTRTQTLYDYLDAPNMDRAVKVLDGVCKASRDLKSKVLTFSVETRSPELSQQVTQRATQLLETFVQGKGRTRGGCKAAFAEARLKEARAEMGVAEEELRIFLDRNRNYQMSADPSVRIRGGRLESELKLHQQLVMTLSMNREQSLMEEKNDVPILNVLDPGNLPIDKSRPARALIVLLAFFMASVGAWTWLNREWIRTRLGESDGDADDLGVSRKELS